MTSQPFPTRIFIDSGANLALIDDGDEHYAEACRIQQDLVRFRPRIFTTNFIKDESYTLILAALGRQKALDYLDRLYTSSFTIEPVLPAGEQRAEAILRQFQDKAFSYTDATSFAVMDRLSLTYAFAFDRNFEQYGKILLRA